MDSGHFVPVTVGAGRILKLRRVQSTFAAIAREGKDCRLVAVSVIPEGHVALRLIGTLTGRATRYSVQVGEHQHLDVLGQHSQAEIYDRYFWRFMNHGCEPNMRLSGMDFIALRTIQPWEDVTFNYNTTEWDMASPFQCHCRSPRCAGVVRGFKHLSHEERMRLRPWLAPYLAAHLPLPAPVSAAAARAAIA